MNDLMFIHGRLVSVKKRKEVEEMEKISVYGFVMNMYQAKEITVHAWTNDENGNEICRHFTTFDKFDSIFYGMRDYQVDQFKVTKRGCIDIICSNFK